VGLKGQHTVRKRVQRVSGGSKRLSCRHAVGIIFSKQLCGVWEFEHAAFMFSIVRGRGVGVNTDLTCRVAAEQVKLMVKTTG
jgi:hypothetical protein